MRAEVVLNSIDFFQKKLKPAFQERLSAYGDSNEQDEHKRRMSAVVAVEKEIRCVILENLLADDNVSIEEKNFIRKNNIWDWWRAIMLI